MRALAILAYLAVTGGLTAADYRVVDRIAVGGEGSWDYLTVDRDGHRLFVSHGTHVAVIDLQTGKPVADIPNTPGVHGITLAQPLQRGFISCGRANHVLIFDLKTLKPLGEVSTGENPDAILFDAASGRLFTFNGRSKDSTVIDAASGKVLATIPLGGKPEFSAVDGHGKLWVNIEDTHEIVELNTAKATVTRRYPLTGCEEPSGLALDAKKLRLFSVCGNEVMVVSDIATGKVIAKLPIGEGSDGVAFDAERGMAFSSNGSGTLTVVAEAGAGYKVAATLPTERGARTITLDPGSHKLYSPTAQFGPVPAATAQQPHPRPPALPGTFHLLVIGQ
ncbi:YncE family protein [Paludibaculum fermentans]|uniref:YncE family protein n=1 Tax=Paludibaculum fermentans TaxID=1473598 RepID=A0A7S7NKB2_PALFE|nr:YncE family protein [Paludibaculum fermentans]QOY85125.1 YncE family protein [Paludibaculum fermentans]